MHLFRVLFLGLLFLAAGCGPALPEGAQPTHPITVTVKYKGAPVEGAANGY